MRSKKKKKVKINLTKFIPFVIVIALIFVGAVTLFAPETLPGPEIIYAPEESTRTISIRCVGDIMTHAPQIDAAYVGGGTYYEYDVKSTYSTIKSDGNFDYTPCFEYVQKYFEEADLVLGNMETTCSGDKVYTGYPGFDGPDEIAANVKSVGIDVALFANNHMLDTKLAGAKRTVQVLRAAGLDVVGARTDVSENRSIVIEKNGLKIGIIAYTYETPTVNGQRTLNGSSGSGMNSGAPEFINTFRYTDSGINSEDLKSMKNELDWCRQNGAQIVIAYLHWGNEYQKSPSKNDQALAKYLAENGADIIFASHPHVIQKIDTIEVEVPYNEEWSSQVYPRLGETPERTGLQKFKAKLGIAKEEVVPDLDVVARPKTYTKTVPIYYSMGNFVSNQRSETLTDAYGAETAKRTEQGMIACVELIYNEASGEIRFSEIDCVPTWVDKYKDNGKTVYKVIPLLDNLDSNKALKISGHKTRAKEALTAITQLLGAEYIKNN